MSDAKAWLFSTCSNDILFLFSVSQFVSSLEYFYIAIHFPQPERL